MNQKIYVIRKIAYQYSDEFWFVNAPGGIEHVYYDEAEARQRLQELECPMFRDLDLGNIEQLSPCGCSQQFRQQREALDRYLKETLGKSLFTYDDRYDDLYMEMHIYLPQQVSDEQIMQIRAISGVKFYDLSVFEDEACFYAIWLPQNNAFYSTGNFGEGYAIYFFNTHEEALERAQSVRWGLSMPGAEPPVELPGTLAELSEQPAILQSLIQQHDSLIYDEQQAVLTFHCGPIRHLPHDKDEFIMLNALLRQPFFEIRTISLAEAEQIPHTPFEVM